MVGYGAARFSDGRVELCTIRSLSKNSFVVLTLEFFDKLRERTKTPWEFLDTADGENAKLPQIGDQRTDNHQRRETARIRNESQSKADVAADTKTEETKKPAHGFWGWGYYGALAAVCVVLFFYFRRHWRKK